MSWGIGCRESDYPGVYADVSKAACWIDKTVACYEGTLAEQGSFFGFNEEECPREECDPDLDTRASSSDLDEENYEEEYIFN